MRRDILFLASFTSIMMLLGILGMMRYHVSIALAFIPVILLFLVFSLVVVWRNCKRDSLDHTESKKNRIALKWLFVPFGISALIALVTALQEGWTVGDTIGAIFFGIFVLLIGYEMLHKRRATHLQ